MNLGGRFMRVLISADMEGISGIAERSFVLTDGKNYDIGRSFMESDVNAAIEGALSAGANEIYVTDAHNSGNNLRLGNLNPEAKLISGSGRPFPMIAGYEKVDVAMFVGYHARLGTSNAVLDHTYTSRLRLWINGIEAGESYMNALLCGSKGVPVILYSGDSSLAKEVEQFSPNSCRVVVKEAFGRSSAALMHPQKSYSLINESAKRACEKWQAGEINPVTTTNPVEIKVEFIISEMAEQAAVLPGAKQIDPRTVISKQPDIEMGIKAFLSMIALAKAPVF